MTDDVMDWDSDYRQTATCARRTARRPPAPIEFPHERDEKGRVKMPAFLLTAHKPGSAT